VTEIIEYYGQPKKPEVVEMRRKGDRRLIDVIMAVERRKRARRDLEEGRRQVADRRIVDLKIEEERREKSRRAQDIEKLKFENPEFNLPIES
jgi:hypothetical protein